MKKFYVVFSLFGSVCWADPVGISSGPPMGVPSAPVVSTAPPSVALVGETKTLPAPRAMTDSSGSDAFVTLTRSAFSREELPANTEVITAAQIKRLGARDAGEAISTLTGIRINRVGMWASPQFAGIRGATPEQTLILVDGRPIGGVGLSDSQNLSEIAAEQIDRIEVVRGGAAALYGPAASGGVINIISKRAYYEGLPISHVGVDARAYAGQNYTLDFGSRYGPADFFFYGNRTRERGLRFNEDSRTYHIGGNVGLGLGKGGKVLFDVASYHADAGSPGQRVPDLLPSGYDGNSERLAATPSAKQDTGSDALRMSYLLPLPGDSLFALRAFGSTRQIEYENPDVLVSRDRQEQSKGGDLELHLPWKFLLGANYVHDRVDYQDHAVGSVNTVKAMESWGVFAQKIWTSGIFSLIPTVRFDRNSQSGSTMLPRTLAVVNATSWLRLSGSAGRSVRAPTLDDLFSPELNLGSAVSYRGNPSLRREKVWMYDAGVELHESSKSVKVSYFFARYSDFIQDSPGLAVTPMNIDRAQRQGAEIHYERVWSASFSERFNYTYVENRGIPPGFVSEVDLRLSPRHMANYRIQWTFWKNVCWDNAVRWTGDYYEGNDRSGEKISSYATWDTRFQFPIRQMDLYVGLNNVLRKHYRERAGFALPGRMIYGGVSLRLWG